MRERERERERNAVCCILKTLMTDDTQGNAMYSMAFEWLCWHIPYEPFNCFAAPSWNAQCCFCFWSYKRSRTTMAAKLLHIQLPISWKFHGFLWFRYCISSLTLTYELLCKLPAWYVICTSLFYHCIRKCSIRMWSTRCLYFMDGFCLQAVTNGS